MQKQELSRQLITPPHERSLNNAATFPPPPPPHFLSLFLLCARARVRVRVRMRESCLLGVMDSLKNKINRRKLSLNLNSRYQVPFYVPLEIFLA